MLFFFFSRFLCPNLLPQLLIILPLFHSFQLRLTHFISNFFISLLYIFPLPNPMDILKLQILYFRLWMITFFDNLFFSQKFILFYSPENKMNYICVYLFIFAFIVHFVWKFTEKYFQACFFQLYLYYYTLINFIIISHKYRKSF